MSRHRVLSFDPDRLGSFLRPGVTYWVVRHSSGLYEGVSVPLLDMTAWHRRSKVRQTVRDFLLEELREEFQVLPMVSKRLYPLLLSALDIDYKHRLGSQILCRREDHPYGTWYHVLLRA